MTYREEIIGDARLILGDCLEILPTLGRVDHVICDPPYEAAIHESNKALAQGGALRDKRNPFRAFGFEGINEIRAKVVRVSADAAQGWFIAFCTIEGVAEWAKEIEAQEGIKYKRPCLWIKPDAMPQFSGDRPGIGAEAFVTAWCGGGRSVWQAGGKKGVYTHNTGGGDRHGSHPTEKPVALMSDLVSDFTRVGQTVADPFMGSGTTGVACAKLGRKFIGIELEPKYFDIACRRIDDAYKQPRLFAEPAPKPVQANLLDGAA